MLKQIPLQVGIRSTYRGILKGVTQTLLGFLLKSFNTFYLRAHVSEVNPEQANTLTFWKENIIQFQNLAVFLVALRQTSAAKKEMKAACLASDREDIF